MENKISTSFICVYLSDGEHFGKVVLLRVCSFLNFQVQLGHQFTLENLSVESQLVSVCSRKKIIVLSVMFVIWSNS